MFERVRMRIGKREKWAMGENGEKGGEFRHRSASTQHRSSLINQIFVNKQHQSLKYYGVVVVVFKTLSLSRVSYYFY